MKRVFALCGAALLFLPTFGFATNLTVQAENAPIRSEPTFFGKIVATAHYRSPVELIEERGAWRLVRFNQQQGWMHISALVTKAGLGLVAGEALNGAISSKEVSLAGKGFNKETENAFKKQHRELSFAWVDRMEKMAISPSELEKFAAGGDFSTAAR